ncbi:hypothetical protein D3C71_1674810 [compost metagenome]
MYRQILRQLKRQEIIRIVAYGLLSGQSGRDRLDGVGIRTHPFQPAVGDRTELMLLVYYISDRFGEIG